MAITKEILDDLLTLSGLFSGARFSGARQILADMIKVDQAVSQPNRRSTCSTVQGGPVADTVQARVITKSPVRNRNNKTKTAKELRLTRGQLDYRLKMIKHIIM